MIFKNAQASMPIYLVDRNNVTLETGKITSVVPSHIDMKAGGKMVVDVTCAFSKSNQTYTIEDALSVGYFGNVAISLEMQSVLREIETMKNQSEEVLNNIDKHRDIVEKCNNLLVENNPQLKEKKDLDERFMSMNCKIDRLTEMVEKMFS